MSRDYAEMQIYRKVRTQASTVTTLLNIRIASITTVGLKARGDPELTSQEQLNF